MKILFAPLKGLTDAHFRSFFFRHFHGFDGAVAPFLLSSEDEALRAQREGTAGPVPLIPQLLGNRTEQLISFAGLLRDEGFDRFNLNLGCPARVVIKKSKGSALLAEPERLSSLLTELSSQSPLPFSVKTRLGYYDTNELRPQLKNWKDLPITELIIHARSAVQGYTGPVNREETLLCAREWGRPIIYNGDICDREDYDRIIALLKENLSGVMIGRGIFHNPFLAEEIKKGTSLEWAEKRERFIDFHEDISGEMRTRPKSFARLKGLWTYFSSFARIPPGELERMKRIDDPDLFCREAKGWVSANLR
ncbi:MAG: tRNA-dihydrouridine synthase family protein [Spirochaetales bacterium]|nr:tRNA-dihydrouridine synthase family protein [Spirochaetales bacterium]